MIAAKWSLTRAAMEEYAVRSHERAIAARAEGRFAREIEPVAGVTADEGPRAPELGQDPLAAAADRGRHRHPSGFSFRRPDLAGRLRQFGFVPAKIYPVHFHGLPTNLKSQFPALHKEIANLIARLAPYDPRLTPYCSTFVLDVRKP